MARLDAGEMACAAWPVGAWGSSFRSHWAGRLGRTHRLPTRGRARPGAAVDGARGDQARRVEKYARGIKRTGERNGYPDLGRTTGHFDGPVQVAACCGLLRTSW